MRSSLLLEYDSSSTSFPQYFVTAESRFPTLAELVHHHSVHSDGLITQVNRAKNEEEKSDEGFKDEVNGEDKPTGQQQYPHCTCHCHPALHHHCYNCNSNYDDHHHQLCHISFCILRQRGTSRQFSRSVLKLMSGRWTGMSMTIMTIMTMITMMPYCPTRL